MSLSMKEMKSALVETVRVITMFIDRKMKGCKSTKLIAEKYSEKHGLILNNFTFQNIRSLNQKVQELMNEKHKSVVEIPEAQEEFNELCKALCKRGVIQNFWFIPYCVDLFIPSYQKEEFLGCAIEVDGIVHDRDDVIRKDISKEVLLKKLNIACKRVRNEHIHKYDTKEFLRNFKDYKIPDSRTKRNYLTKIYAHNIVAFSIVEYRLEFLRELFGMADKNIISLAVELGCYRKGLTTNIETHTKFLQLKSQHIDN